MHTRKAPPRAISEWLTRTHPAPEQAQKEWATQGVALLPLGERFAAVRMASDIVHAAVRSGNPDQVALALSELLRGAVICDRRVAGGTYYALIEGHAGLVWAYDDIATCLGAAPIWEWRASTGSSRQERTGWCHRGTRVTCVRHRRSSPWSRPAGLG